LGGSSPTGKKRFVLLVRTNPEPDDHVVAIKEANGPVAATDSSREDRIYGVYLFEVKTRMMRALRE
jgi:uncharacterized protein (DUF2252 family)